MRTVYLIPIVALAISCQKPGKIVLWVNECHESACTDMQLYDNGTFELEWSFPSGSSAYEYSSPTQYYHGLYLIKREKILLYTDSIFDATDEAKKLDTFRKSNLIEFENRSKYSGEMKWVDGSFKPHW